MRNLRPPDGAEVRTASIFDRKEDDQERSFGLYMDERWQPTWPAELIEWKDFGLPAHPETAVAQIEAAYDRARRGEVVEVGCVGGLGRTGTVLACMAVLAGLPADEAVAWVRTNYDCRAVETLDQEEWVLWFAKHAARR